MAVNGILLGQSDNNKFSTVIISQNQWIEDNGIYKTNIKNNNFNEIGCFIVKPVDNISSYIKAEIFLKEISNQNFIFYASTKPSIDYQINILYLFDGYQKIINIFNNNNYQNSFIESTSLIIFPSNNISFSNQNLIPHANGAVGNWVLSSESIETSTTQSSAYTWGGVQGISNTKIDFSLYNKLYIEFDFNFTVLDSSWNGPMGGLNIGITEGINTDTYTGANEKDIWIQWWHHEQNGGKGLKMTENYPGINTSQNYPSIVTSYNSKTAYSKTGIVMEIDVSSINKEAYLAITNTACGGTTKIKITKIFLE